MGHLDDIRDDLVPVANYITGKAELQETVDSKAGDDLASQAQALLGRALISYDEKYGCGSMSCAIYDTAWVSMVTKYVDGERQWLFPQSFRFLLDNQSQDGSWGSSPFSQIDGILNTTAGLLSLLKHSAEALQLEELSRDDLQTRISNAAVSLTTQLRAWNVEATRHVGFEVIVPSLLQLLEDESPSLELSFGGKEALMAINEKKLSRFRPEILYKMKTTALHSLEAFVGKIDFDKVKHHLVHGSMMGSPSSTAAYLMHSSQWDDEAEAYLRRVVDFADGKGNGGVPSAYPSLYFEHTWILSTLFRGGFSGSDLQCDSYQKIINILQRAFKDGNGVIGFAPGFEADMDDTAKGIVSLNMSDREVSAEGLVKAFESEHHFKTYPMERDPSFSANCNAVLSLIHQTNPSQYTSGILKATRFLCSYWWDSDAGVKDKWSLCSLYPCLLLVEAFSDVLEAVENGRLDAESFDSETRCRISITLFQASSRALLEQREDGSWMGLIEATSYGVLILSEARKVCFFNDLQSEIDDGINRGIDFLRSASSTPQSTERIWIEKVSYGSPRLTEAYVLAAHKAASNRSGTGSVGTTLGLHSHIKPEKQAQYVKLFRQTPLFGSLSKWEVKLSAIEAALFMPLLRARRLEVFPRKDMEKDKYFEIIPFTWTSCNNRTRTFASTNFLYDMMVISFLNYQADEFMEAVAGPAFQNNLTGLRHFIHDLFAEEDVNTNVKANTADSLCDKEPANGTNGHDKANGVTKAPNGATTNGSISRDQNETVGIPLRQFISHVLHHPSIAKASSWDRKTLLRELRVFLLAHVTQTEDNASFAGNPDTTQSAEFTSAKESFFQWVRTTSANHTSCPYSFAFVSSLIGAALGDGADCFPSTYEKYLAEAACRHLATMCRMYNDFGSLARDRAESNLNSVNFPEFHRGTQTDMEKKSALFAMAEYERGCLDLTIDKLEKEGQNAEQLFSRKRGKLGGSAELGSRKMRIWRMFCDVTDLYGQIYVVRDIASRMVASS